MIKDKLCYFGFRLEENLAVGARAYCRREGICRNEFIGRVLESVARLHDAGRICFSGVSRFLLRKNQDDRVETVLSLLPGQHEVLRNLAIAYRLSMAEVLRIGMELFLDRELYGNSDNPVHYYSCPKRLIRSVIVPLYPALPPDHPPYPLLI